MASGSWEFVAGPVVRCTGLSGSFFTVTPRSPAYPVARVGLEVGVGIATGAVFAEVAAIDLKSSTGRKLDDCEEQRSSIRWLRLDEVGVATEEGVATEVGVATEPGDFTGVFDCIVCVSAMVLFNRKSNGGNNGGYVKSMYK